MSKPLLERIIRDFSVAGGRVVRFDGGGDPLLHPDIRNGALPELSRKSGLKSTILTSGDLLGKSNLTRIGNAECYIRVSINAATDRTRKLIHSNSIPLRTVFHAIGQHAEWLDTNRSPVPLAATFLIDRLNFNEISEAARISKELGVKHFSARRVLGPKNLRPAFSDTEVQSMTDQFREIEEMKDDDFLTFVPWRPIDEPDLSPTVFNVQQCWQSTFKTVLEPGSIDETALTQLCGRYRGSGVGQETQLPPLFMFSQKHNWVRRWVNSFSNYPVHREALPNHCTSCIDRGFITMIDRLIDFLESRLQPFEIHHLKKPKCNSN